LWILRANDFLNLGLCSGTANSPTLNESKRLGYRVAEGVCFTPLLRNVANHRYAVARQFTTALLVNLDTPDCRTPCRWIVNLFRHISEASHLIRIDRQASTFGFSHGQQTCCFTVTLLRAHTHFVDQILQVSALLELALHTSKP